VRAVGLLSGGLDSTVALALLHAREPGSVVLALTFDYGQRAAARETEAAARIAARLGVRHRTVELPFFRDLAGGALLDRAQELPRPDLAALDRGGAALAESATGLGCPPQRRIEVAAAFAESLAPPVRRINREEAATFPDNSASTLRR
jgi:7-cyano-7-deazaguanine synthase